MEENIALQIIACIQFTLNLDLGYYNAGTTNS